MLKTVLYPKDLDSVSGWIPDVGDGSVLKEPVRNVANLLEHRKVSIGLPYKIHLQREINDDKIFFGENGSDAKLEITNLQLFIPVITPSIEVETIIFNSLTKDIEIAFLHRNTVAADAATGGISAAVKADNAKKAADAKVAEERRHNLIMEKEAKGSGVGEMIGTIKEFGKRFGEETKKTVKQGLNKLVDSIDTGEVKVKHKGNGIFLKNIHTGEGIYLSKYKGEGVIFGTN
ncbi:hypothetical protein LOTGIDRAFT_165429 [Lottia gigantea]|uniref:Uncharacterized protein n=1 Tax=Lottia gigantea TaxID=225164 RepID=V4A130_LOTGI|nr:hypothetical protein LOTGIDRAFT_165429 [Lottia gigantea]ESO88645.1 hypothetical protein LOTGIDRAFT_165429 [Lottia gigantea]